jgi:hypothetical protein
MRSLPTSKEILIRHLLQVRNGSLLERRTLTSFGLDRGDSFLLSKIVA